MILSVPELPPLDVVGVVTDDDDDPPPDVIEFAADVVSLVW